MDCLFCKIINKEIKASVIYEDENSLAMLDIHPRSAGHTMVIPKVHAETILDLGDEKIAQVFGSVKKVATILEETLQPEGFTIGINHGKVSGQAIEHLHIHIIPRWNNDSGGSIHSVVNNPPKESVEEVAQRILNYKIKM